jgi:23S rRNA (adenine2503-C2)-methyltransferase
MMSGILEILSRRGEDGLAFVYIARTGGKRKGHIEFVESLQPPLPREKKWVLIVSTMEGCPVGCPICDANSQPGAPLSVAQILAQIDHMVSGRYPDGEIPVEKFKVQFARMGDPALNPAVIEVLETLPALYRSPALMPCVSTIAPRKGIRFLERLIRTKNDLYPGGRFQMQFSVHSTSERQRDFLMPYPKMTLGEIAGYGNRYFADGDRKITLNFATPRGFEIDTGKMRSLFSPERFLIKITPVNPTRNQKAHRLESLIIGERPEEAVPLVSSFEEAGFDVILSIGELGENAIGSNCGQFITRHLSKESTGNHLRDVC